MKASAPRVWTVLLAFGCVVAGLAVSSGAILVALIVRRLGPTPELARDKSAIASMAREVLASPGFLIGSVVATSLVLLTVALLAARVSREPLRTRLALEPSRLSPKTLAVAVLGCLAISSIGDEVFGVLGREPGGSIAALRGLVTGSGPGRFVFVLFAAALLAPLAEETFFRGYVQRRLSLRWGARTGIAVSAALFALMHFDWVHGPSAFLIGLFLGWLAQRSGSIRPSMVAHAANNGAWALATRAGLGGHLSRASHAVLLVAYVGAAIWIVAFLARALESRGADDAFVAAASGDRLTEEAS
jgi:membrane protease YdiL (CAAX protease family)